MAFRFFVFIIVLSFISSSSFGDRNQKLMNRLNLITENYPPFNFVEKGKLKGFAVDLLLIMLKESGSDLNRKDIKVRPWARGYNTVLNKKNTILFAMDRTKNRENLFRWVGPIESSNVAIMAHNSSNIKIRSRKNLSELKINIATIMEDSGQKLLLESGFGKERIYTTSSPESLVNLLKYKRYQLICYGEITTKWFLKKSGSDPDQFKVVYSFDDIKAYYAINKNSSGYVVKQLQKALNRLKKSGRYKRIVAKYIK